MRNETDLVSVFVEVGVVDGSSTGESVTVRDTHGVTVSFADTSSTTHMDSASSCSWRGSPKLRLSCESQYLHVCTCVNVCERVCVCVCPSAVGVCGCVLWLKQERLGKKMLGQGCDVKSS